MKKQFLGLASMVMLFVGLFASPKAYADSCQGNHGSCTLTWWCCNCHGVPGCREEVIVLEGYKNGPIE